MLIDLMLRGLEEELRASLGVATAGLVDIARIQLEDALAEVTKERAKGLADVAKEKADLHLEIAAMQKQQEAQQGRVVLYIGGYRYTTSVQTKRRLPGTFFDAYFSGRYTMDRSEDGSIFIDRDGKHFGQILEYLRGGMVSAAAKDASELDVGELRWLKREFGFYCIELYADPQEVAFVVGGVGVGNICLASVERYDVSSGAWREAAPMATTRAELGLCSMSDNELYATGGVSSDGVRLAGVERYDPRLDIWSVAPSLPRPRYAHCACVVGNAMYVLGGIGDNEDGGLETVKSVLNFDCRMQTWSDVAPMPEERYDAGVCVVGGDIFIFGGRTDNDVTTSATYRFSTATDKWATLAPMPEANLLHSVSVLNSLIYILGGEDEDETFFTSVHRFDPVANIWSIVAPMSVARTIFGSFVLGGSIYAVGGFNGEDMVTSIERYSVALDSWSEVLEGELSTVRGCFGALAVQLEVDLFDSLIAKANNEGL